MMKKQGLWPGLIDMASAKRLHNIQLDVILTVLNWKQLVWPDHGNAADSDFSSKFDTEYKHDLPFPVDQAKGKKVSEENHCWAYNAYNIQWS